MFLNGDFSLANVNFQCFKIKRVEAKILVLMKLAFSFSTPKLLLRKAFCLKWPSRLLTSHLGSSFK